MKAFLDWGLCAALVILCGLIAGILTEPDTEWLKPPGHPSEGRALALMLLVLFGLAAWRLFVSGIREASSGDQS